MLNYFLTLLYEYEITINGNIQKQFKHAEPLLKNVNDYLDPSFILDLWIPLLGGCNHKLLVQLAASIGLINTLASVIKWCIPEYRPVWWIKEIKENAGNFKYNLSELKLDAYSCDTSAAFPSAHTAAFAALALIVGWCFVESFLSAFSFMLWNKYLTIYAITSLLSAFLWFSRLYFLEEFFHQCLFGSLLAAGMIKLLKRNFKQLLNLGKLKAFLMLLAFSLIPISVYYGMLYINVDPFWSVRMAFKWCPDPMYLKHESSPVFTLCRDFGYIMGVALSCPLASRYDKSANSYLKRLPILFIMEIVNVVFRSYTPKQYGRFVFVAYEFLRNCLHSFMLLTVLPKIDAK